MLQWVVFSLSSKNKKKNKKNPCEKNSYIFSKRVFFIYFREMELLYFRKWKFLAPSFKTFLYFRKKLFELKKYKKKHSEKLSYISRKWNFVVPSFKTLKHCFLKKFLRKIFQQKSYLKFRDECWSSSKIKKMSYTLGWLLIKP